MRKRIDHWCSVVPEKSQVLFPTGTVDPRVGIFLSPLGTNNGFYLSHLPVPASTEDQTTTCRSHAGPKSIRGVIKMLK